MRRVKSLVGALLGCLWATTAIAAPSVSVDIVPTMVTVGTPTDITYTITNSSGTSFSGAYVTVPTTFPVKSAGSAVSIPAIVKSSSCALSADKASTFGIGRSCHIVFTINTPQYGRLVLNGLMGYNQQQAPFAMTSITALVRPSQVYFFGDSYTDIGNINPVASKDLFPKTTPWWPSFFYTDLQLGSVYPSVLGGTDFAHGGSQSGYAAQRKAVNEDFLDQVKDFTLKTQGALDPNALVIVWTGGNDFTHNVSAQTTVSNIQTGINALSQLGVRNIVVINQGPWASSINGLLNTMVTTFNQTHTAAPLVLFDYNTNFITMTHNPKTYGFVNVVDACKSNPTTCTQPNWWYPSIAPFLNVVSGLAPASSVALTPLQAWWWNDSVHPTPCGHLWIETMIRNYLFPVV